MAIKSLFSVPSAHYSIDNWETNKQIILDALPTRVSEHLDSNGLVYTDFFHQDQAGLPEYADTVLPIIGPYLTHFSEGACIEFTDMWFQTALRNQRHPMHNHGGVGWSAVIYVEFDPTVHTSTQFISPFDNPWDGQLQTFSPPMQEGDIIIFPASLKHEALENNSDVRRTIISFNMRGYVTKVRETMGFGLPARNRGLSLEKV